LPIIYINKWLKWKGLVMSSNTKIMIGIIAFFTLLLGLLTFLGRGDIVEKQSLNGQAIFKVYGNEEELKTYTMERLTRLGQVDFSAYLKSSGHDSKKQGYKGVLLKDVLIDAGIDLDKVDKAVVYAIDGYVVAISREKLMDDDNVYLAYMCEGQLIASKDQGGDGPYQVIISKDEFSQYWCKYAYKVDVTINE